MARNFAGLLLFNPAANCKAFFFFSVFNLWETYCDEFVEKCDAIE